MIWCYQSIWKGRHALHIHEGNSDNCAESGRHFNPTNEEHPRHLGDLGNIVARRTRNGSTQTKFRIKAPRRTSLIGRHSIYNQTLVIHAREDDLSPNPSPGPKVICGQILPTPLINGIPARSKYVPIS